VRNYIRKRWAELLMLALVFVTVLLAGALSAGLVSRDTFSWWAIYCLLAFAVIGAVATVIATRRKNRE
jgi:hypothetical protein